MKYISPNEISELLNKDRIIIYRKHYVYDITSLIKKHPGGEICLFKKNNSQCEDDFEFHHESSRKKWKKYLIGTYKAIQYSSFESLINYVINKL